MDTKPIWMMEICISEHQPKEVVINPNFLSTFNVFWDRAYEAWSAGNGGRAGYIEEIEKIVKSNTDILYTDNFLFIEKGKISELLNC
jgi:hypothetical protein